MTDLVPSAENGKRDNTEKNLKKPLPLVPEKIPNFDELVSQESIGGNAGPRKAGLMGKVEIGEKGKGIRLVSNHKGEGIDFVFRVGMDILQMVELLRQGKLPPPGLIEEAEMRGNAESEEPFVAQIARNHNAYEIVDFINKGGDISLLQLGEQSKVHPAYIPSLKEIQAYMDKQNKKSIIDKLRGRFSRER